MSQDSRNAQASGTPVILTRDGKDAGNFCARDFAILSLDHGYIDDDTGHPEFWPLTEAESDYINAEGARQFRPCRVCFDRSFVYHGVKWLAAVIEATFRTEDDENPLLPDRVHALMLLELIRDDLQGRLIGIRHQIVCSDTQLDRHELRVFWHAGSIHKYYQAESWRSVVNQVVETTVERWAQQSVQRSGAAAESP